MEFFSSFLIKLNSDEQDFKRRKEGHPQKYWLLDEYFS